MVVYHHDDLDGISAAAIIAAKNPDLENTTFKKFSYGDKFNTHNNDSNIKEEVLLLDISFSKDTYEQLKTICNEAKSVIWIDHHATSVDMIDKYKDELQKIQNLTYFVSNKHCGALLTYAYMNIPTNDLFKIRDTKNKETYNISISDFLDNTNEIEVQLFKYSKDTMEIGIEHKIKIPKWLIYVDDYDCWKKKDKNSNYFQLGIMAEDEYNITYYDNDTDRLVLNNMWINIVNQGVDPLEWVQKGKIIYNYLMRKYKDEFGMTFIWNYDGKKFLCKNSTGNSYNFLDQSSKYDATILFAYNGATGKWEYSIYSDENTGIDCKEFAEKLGGGGHIHASGFSTDKLIFIEKNPIVSEFGLFSNVNFK